jgi:diguanylate cyclase (GGDEF)-like protein/PAS domain S-box-containing protein
MVGIYETNLKGDIRYVNEALCRIAGYDSPEEMMSENVITKYKNKDDREVLIKLLKENGSVNNFEIDVLNKNSDTITVLLNAVLDGDVISGMIMDVSSRKQAEKTLIHAREEWEKTFDAIPDLILVVDNQHKILKANRALALKAGMKREELIGRFCFDVMHGSNEVPAHCLHTKTIKDGKEHISEMYKEKLNGFYIVSSSPIYDPEGRSLGIVEVARDITERKKMEEKLRVMAMTDELTGLFNRRGFFTLSEKHCKLADRTKRKMSLMYLDIDGMKTINDKLGHKAGDQALTDIAKILKESFRESDLIARIGGDEFVVLLTEHSESDIEYIITNNIKNNLKAHNKQDLRNYELSLSMGIVHYDPKHPCTIDNLIAKADALMYDVKKNHKLKEEIVSSTSERESESRVYKRFSIGNDCWAEINSSDKVSIKDISVGGVCLRTSMHLDPSSTCKIKVLSSSENIVSDGIVVWSYLMGTKTEKGTSQPYYETGLKFIEMNEKIKNSLEKYISSITG